MVLVRYAPVLPDGTIGTVMYTAGVVPADTTEVEFFIARSSFDPDRDVSTTTVTVVE